MSEWYDQGYKAGYDDGLNGRPNSGECMLLGMLESALGGHTEEEWNEGYEDGYEAGEEERKNAGESTSWF